MSKRLHASLAAVLHAACCSLAQAQSPAPAPAFPSKPVTLIMPFTPGSSTDMEARIYQDELSPLLRVPVLLDYKPGGGGVLANSALAKSAPDGHTIAWSSATIALHPATRENIPYDMFRDLVPVTQTTKRTFVLAVSPLLPVNTYEEFIAHARANPGKVTWSTVGAGGSQHMTGEWLAAATGIRMTFVHYKGASVSDLDMMAGRISAAPKGLISTLPLLKSKKVKVLAIVTADRSAQLPDVKPVSEMGIPGFNYPGWVGIFAPGGTPPAIVSRLHAEFRRALTTPRAMKEWAATDTHVVASTPEEFRQMLTVEVARWKKLAKDNNIRLTDENS